MMKNNALLVLTAVSLLVSTACTSPGVAKTCLPGSTDCGNGCVTLKTDESNCGTCGHACGQGFTCQAGTCTGTYIADNATTLYVPPGQTYLLSGDKCYTQSVVVEGSLVVTPFNSATGGVLTLRSPSITVRATGAIVADASGGGGGLQAPAQGGMQGVGVGLGCGGGVGSCVGQGGSGGGYGGAGAKPSAANTFAINPCDRCSNPTVAHCENTPGSAYGSAGGIDVAMGSGGGAGGNSCGTTFGGGRGGAGGGAISLLATNVTIDGAVSAAGEKPPASNGPANVDYNPGGGGGSGGTVLVRANTLGGAGQIAAPGGAGGNSPGTGTPADWGWAGGGGGGGRVKIFATTDGFTGTVGAAGGAGGAATCTGPDCLSGSDATDGTVARTTIPAGLVTIGCAGL